MRTDRRGAELDPPVSGGHKYRGVID